VISQSLRSLGRQRRQTQPRPLNPNQTFAPCHFKVLPEQAGKRLDQFLAGELPDHSRAAIRRAIDAGLVLVDGAASRPAARLKAGSQVAVLGLDVPRAGPLPEDIAIPILYEDEAIVVVDKPAGTIVHPARGHWHGTLASALAYHFGRLSGRGGPARPGIVHRLDRDTSGAIVVAKNDAAHDGLAAQFKDRAVTKEYLAIVVGAPDRDGDVIREPIGNHPTERHKKAIRRADASGREAVTQYEVVERFRGFALVRCLPKTGRTHQIRLHLAHIGCPVLCDRLYGGRAAITELELISRDNLPHDTMAAARPLLERQALHAHRLAIIHPTTGQRLEFEAPLPVDFSGMLAALRRWRHL
jgi:23S rRNA pseudouridine1911/1915/1917 synthase